MGRPFDISKYRKSVTKSIPGISTGFNDPKIWISTNSFTLNYLISGDFQRGVALGKVAMLAGNSGAGKSLVLANILKNAQDQGIYCILLDTENAHDETWLHAFGVDTSEEKMLKFNVSLINDAAHIISDFVKDYKALPEEERPKVLFAIDSLGMMLSTINAQQFAENSMKGDFGSKPKELYALMRNCVNMLGNLDIGLICTNHTSKSQDIFNPDDVIAGGEGPIFAASMVVAMKKGKLKEDDDGNKSTDVHGIRAMCKIMKTRYSKPFESCEIKIPYSTGIDPYSGLTDLFEKYNLLTKDGNRLCYTSHEGKEYKMFRKAWDRNDDGALDVVMADVMNTPGGLFKKSATVEDTNRDESPSEEVDNAND